MKQIDTILGQARQRMQGRRFESERDMNLILRKLAACGIWWERITDTETREVYRHRILNTAQLHLEIFCDGDY